MEPTKMTLEKVHALKGGQRLRFFRTATPEQVEEFTLPCPGQAHENLHIDYCMTCLNVSWGRVLKPLSEGESDACRIIIA